MADAVFQDVQFLVVDDHTFVRRVVTETLKVLGAVRIMGAAEGVIMPIIMAKPTGDSSDVCVC